MEKTEWLKLKIPKVKTYLQPIMDAFGFTDWDYYVKEDNLEIEILRINNTEICCSYNSEDAIFDEVLKYMMIRRQIYLGAFHNQSAKYLKQYWLK